MKTKKVTKLSRESRSAEVQRRIEGLVWSFVDAPSKGASDSLFYLARERAELLRGKSTRHYRDDHDADRQSIIAAE